MGWEEGKYFSIDEDMVVWSFLFLGLGIVGSSI